MAKFSIRIQCFILFNFNLALANVWLYLKTALNFNPSYQQFSRCLCFGIAANIKAALSKTKALKHFYNFIFLLVVCFNAKEKKRKTKM